MARNSTRLAIFSLLSLLQPLEADETALETTFLARLPMLTPVSQAFQERTAAAIQSIPDNVWRQIHAAGWRVQLAEFVVDVQPDLVSDRPRGWPADATWQNSDAIHLPAERLLVLAEKRRNRGGQVVPSARVAGVLRHELGHAFDMVNGGRNRFRSESKDFRAAYLADVRKMTAESNQELAYYLQDSDAGRQEAFAEAFGILLGGGSDEPHLHAFQECFPQVLALVRRDLQLE
jgi:hypothetical protein